MNFGENYDPSDTTGGVPADYAEVLLQISNFKNAIEKISKSVVGSEEEKLSIVKAATAIVSIRNFKKAYTELDTEYNSLQDEAERLIDSKEANEPHILKRREEIKRRVNELLDYMERFKDVIPDIQTTELSLVNLDKEIKAKAEHLAELAEREMKSIIKPISGNN